MMLKCACLKHNMRMRREVETRLVGKHITYYFTTEETNRLADGASIAGAIGGAIPDPVIGPAVMLTGKIVSVWAKSAVRRGKCMGITWRIGLFYSGPMPFEYDP